MGDASFVQPSFLAGEWSPYAQGRIDLPQYRTAMNVCINAIPVEEGACPRRPAFAFAATTRSGAKGRVLPFNFTDVAPFTIELTAGHLRMFQGRGLVYDSVATVSNISVETPAIVTMAAGESAWATGDQVAFLFASAQSAADCALLRNRAFTITVISATQFSLADAITGASIDGADIGWDGTQVSAQVARILDLTTPYNDVDIYNVRGVQAANVSPLDLNINMLLHNSYKPQTLNATLDSGAPNFSTFAIAPQDFIDGPYLDPVSGATLTPNATSGDITLTLGYNAWDSTTAYTLGDYVSFSDTVYVSISDLNVNHEPDTSPTYWMETNAGAAVGPNGFQSTDVGRSIRLLSEPATWNSGTAYSTGEAVLYNGAYYVAVNGNEGEAPDQNLTDWLPTDSPSVFTWTWGKITQVLAANEVVVNLFGEDADGKLANLLYTQPITLWQIGAYSDTTGWPACGAYYEGRLWLSGAIQNRIDGSNSNDPFNFAPTGPDGTVGDANSVNATFDSDDVNNVFWMMPMSQGLVCGTKSGEWMVQASALNDPITPTSIQAHRQTKVGCYNQIPCHTPLTLVFINRYQRLLYEYFPDVFSGKMTAPNLNVYSKHLTASGVEEIAYQSELTPIVWGRTGDGKLIGWTYRRVSAFANEEPKFVGAHQHVLGSGRLVESLTVGPSPDQTSDSVIIVTNDAATGIRHVEMSTPLLQPEDPLTAAWFVDDSITPSGMQTGTVNGVAGVTFFGLWHLNGSTVSAVVGGLDCGDYVVANGQIFVPWQSDPGKLFTLAYIDTLNGGDYGDLASPIDVVATVVPSAANTPQVIQEYTFPNINVSGINGNKLIVDWPNANMYALGGNGVRVIDVNTGLQKKDATFTQITTGAPDPGVNTNWGWALGTDGNLYFQQGALNTGPIIKVSASTLQFVSSFGVDGNGLGAGPGGVAKSPYLIPIFAGGSNYLVCVCTATAFAKGIATIKTDNMSFMQTSGVNCYENVSEEGLAVCAGHQGSDYGSVFGIGYPTGEEVGISTTTLYQVMIQNGVSTVTKPGTISVGQVDSTWDTFTSVVGPAFDQTDGNVLVGFGTSKSGVTNSKYLCKINVADGSILWKTAVSGLPDANGMNNSRISAGVYGYLTGGVGFSVNTSNGQVNTFTIFNVLPVGTQVFDDVTGSITLYSDYTQADGSPVPAPGSPDSWLNQFARLTCGGVFFGTTISRSRLTIPAVIGFTYTTQGQIVRPSAPQEAGAQNGPAQGKTRRSHMFNTLLAGAITNTLSFGTRFTGNNVLRPAVFKTPGNQPYDTLTLYNGVFWSTLEDNYSFDGMICWQISRPLPANVVSIGGFINTQDR